jgi:integrase
MARLPKGMFSRGSSYYVRRYIGRKDRWICLGDDLEVAKNKLRKIRQGEEPVVESRLTVSEAADKWLDSYIATSRNEKCRVLARTRVKLWLKPFMGYLLLRKVSREDLRAYRIWLEQKRSITLQTVAHILSDARCFFRWCEDAGLIDRCPVPRKLLPRIQERPPDRLTEDEVTKLVALPEPYGFVIRFALGTGLRWSELCRAQASHIEKGVLVVSQTKTGKVRRVPLSPELRRECSTRVGKLVPFAESSQGGFARMVKRLGKLERFHAHQTRHTFACQWLERGGSLAALQQILGHSTIVTTQRYARLSDGYVQSEAERLYSQSAG